MKRIEFEANLPLVEIATQRVVMVPDTEFAQQTVTWQHGVVTDIVDGDCRDTDILKREIRQRFVLHRSRSAPRSEMSALLPSPGA